MKNWKISIGTAVAVGMAGWVFAQGSITPPGEPGVTMKSLEQVEPRTPISSVPYTISQAGSYYLTTNLTSTGHGVVIRASDVTLDLMGFTLSGDRGTSDYGIFLDRATNGSICNVMIRNGIVRNFGYGVYAEYAQASRFEHLIAATNYNSGIYLYNYNGRCDGNTIANCTISGNFYGIYLDSYYGQCDGNIIAGCTVSGNGNYGILLYGYIGQCDGNVITDCTISGNGNYGIQIYNYFGQCDGNTITGCTIRKNSSRGIYLYYADGNRVEGNHITGQTGTNTTYGIYCYSTEGNLIFRNTCVGQTNNFTMSANDIYGPIVTNTGALSGTDPWANFSR